VFYFNSGTCSFIKCGSRILSTEDFENVCLLCYRYLLQYQEPIPCEQLVTALCDIKQAYTQFGGKEVRECF